jgi:predicted MPP superfamily phosphohydrolase
MSLESRPRSIFQIDVKTHFHADTMTRRAFLACAATATAGGMVFATTRGRHHLEVTRRTIAIRNLPTAFQGFRIAQISDIHMGEFTEPWYLHEVVARANALNADAVLLTGDFISRGPMPESVARRAMPVCAEAVSHLTAPVRYAILGNHDVTVGREIVIRSLAERGIPTLVNAAVPLLKDGDRLWIAGLDDAGTSSPNPYAAIPAAPGAPVILMAHEPDYVDKLRRHPRAPLVDLVLSGHSHGGQVRLPWIGPLVLPPMGQKYVEGLFRFGDMQLYVNRGIGTVGLPFRFNCPSEITEITLVQA